MMLVELSSVPPAALPVAGFKDHLRLGSGFADDGLQDETLAAFLRAALASIEARTGKILLEREFRWSVTKWREVDRQPLPLAPVSAIGAVVQIDRNGTAIPVATERYTLEPDQQRPALIAVGATLPAVPRGGRVDVELLAGYGPDWSDLPADLAQAVMLLAAHFYEYRSATALHGSSMPFSVSALIERYRTVRLFMGGRP
ncbi:head-tail connector protein [Loktanella sp. DJP18]|uniref:head-tail connector protein n=1 Tax=Loktanella sp. DJP18 TaxID=3409788 RepID=UPI003BB6ABCD